MRVRVSLLSCRGRSLPIIYVLGIDNIQMPNLENIFACSMLRKFHTVSTVMEMSLLLVNLNSYRGFNPYQSYVTENNYQTKENNSVTKIEFGQTKEFDSLEDYFAANRYLYYGAFVGRVASRIKDAKFTLDFYTKQNNLGEILAPNTQVEKVAGGFEFTEGPLWHPDGFQQ